MDTQELKALQAPLKQQYREDPASAVITLHAQGSLTDGISCSVETGRAIVEAGLHPATGGDGSFACSGDMLLQALAACAGVTMSSVATARGIDLRGGTVFADGDLDFKGTLGVDREAPVGFTDIRLRFELDTDATDEQIADLLATTERYCVVLQTLRTSPAVEASVSRADAVTLDAAELAVLIGRLEGIADEMGAVLRRAAFSPNIKERADCSAALFTADGELLVQAEHIPVHLGAMPASVRAVHRRVPACGRSEPGRPGRRQRPVRRRHAPQRRHVRRAGVPRRPCSSVGRRTAPITPTSVGRAPGSMPADATEIYQEGLRIPPVAVLTRPCAT